MESTVDIGYAPEHFEAELHRQQQHTALLRDIALASRGGVDPQQVFQKIYERIRQVLPADVFYVALCDTDDAKQYRFALFMDDGQRTDIADRRFGGLTGHILEHKQPVLFRDVYREYHNQGVPSVVRFGKLEKHTRAWMGVPLLIGRDAVGVLSVQSYSEGVYDQRDLEMISTIGDLAAIAIENSMLYQAQEALSQSLTERVTARSEELAALTAIAASFSQGQSLTMQLESSLERLLWLFGMHAGAVYLGDRPTLLHREVWSDTYGLPEPRAWLPIDDDSREARVLRSGQLDEIIEDDHAIVTLPLRSHGESTGIMILYGPARALSDHERSLLESACQQIAVGIENAQLLHEREQQIARLEAINAVAATTSATLDLRLMLDKVVTVLRSLLPIDGLIAATYDEQTRELITGVSWSSDTGQHVIERHAMSTGGRLPHVLRERKPILLRHTDPLHRQLAPQRPWEQGALSWMGAPLESRDGRLLGMLAVQSRRPDAYDRNDLQFLAAVGAQLALDVANAQLYQAAHASAKIAERHAENLTVVHSISRLLNSSLDPSVVLQIATEQLVRLFAIDHCAITIYSSPGWRGEVVAEYPKLGSLGRRVAVENVEDFQNDMTNPGQPIAIESIATDPRTRSLRWLAERLGFQSMLIVPLMSRGKAIGAIGLNNCGARSYSQEEEELCRTIAAQVATALENARLFELSVTRVEQEMEIARSIQANLFPRTLPEIPGVELAVRCIPARETGGDFYDVLALGDDRFGISVGDVSGKSLPAAMMMAVARSIVRSEALDHTRPDEVMRQANTLIAQDVPPDTYVALCYAVYDARRRTLDVAMGGQLMPMIRRADGSASMIAAEGHFPLGIAPLADYRTTQVQLAPGDTVLLYTDGLVEAFSPQRQLFGFERLQATFAEVGAQPAESIVGLLFAAVEAWQDGTARHDDMTAVVLRLS